MISSIFLNQGHLEAPWSPKSPESEQALSEIQRQRSGDAATIQRLQARFRPCLSYRKLRKAGTCM